MKEVPEAYTFLRRYPPAQHVFNPANNKEYKIPYLKLYKKAVERNPLFADEKVFPAYWKEEPHALILAKKQYEFMQNGLDEENAYKNAVEYVDDLESKSYDELKDFIKLMQTEKTKVPIVADAKIFTKISFWRERLKETQFEDMSLADQGELDYFLQCDVLRWHEVSRERRMKDPLFVRQFEKLRKTIFPEIEQAVMDNFDRCENLARF